MGLTATRADRTAAELAAADRERIIHPYLPSSTTERVVMVAGDGCRLRDAEGREYLDATGGLWLAQIGHGRREIAAAAAEQMEALEYFTSFWEFSNDRAIELAELLTSISPERQTHVYFTSGGSEGNEAALKMARYAHWRRNEPERTWILARRQAYHGVGYGSGTATGFDIYHDGFGPMLPHVRHLTQPWPYRAELFDGQDPTDFCLAELERTIDELGGERIAAFIGEPVMGVAGMLVPPDDYWPRVQELLREHGITFIFDEVVSAYGRIGHWFATEHFGVEPDIIVTAKGITSGYAPLGAVLVSDEIAEAVTEEGFPMGFTYNGHPTSCAVALANLGVIEGEGLRERARETGAYILERLGELTELPVVGEVRGVGMMHAVELVADRETREPLPMDAAPQDVIRRETGVIVRDCQHNLVISPPLIMSREEADEVVEAMRSVLERTDPSGRIAAGS
jgi:adenosylmethionine-8-amino-7-oxononanoate aminotransferase